MTPPEYPILAVVGATATGKTSLAVELALAVGGEVVGADASQLYRGMDIGTAKATASERRGVAHHQIDVLDIHEDASVAAYQRHARDDIDAIRARGRVPIVAGGSGLYVRAALDRLEIPPTDPAVRARWEAEAARVGAPALHARLAGIDPAAAENIEPHNARRIVRALEVVELTGRPFSATLPTRESWRPTLFLTPAIDPPEVDRRIDVRTRAMWDGGFLAEVEALAGRGLAGTRTASRSVGYPEGLAVLAGRLGREEAIAEVTRATRRLARRQRRWFGADPRVHAVDPARPVAEVRRLLREAAGDPGPPP